jgi:hypothetical protein
MLGGSLDGICILYPDTVTLTVENQIGKIEAGVLRTTAPALVKCGSSPHRHSIKKRPSSWRTSTFSHAPVLASLLGKFNGRTHSLRFGGIGANVALATLDDGPVLLFADHHKSRMAHEQSPS